MLVKYFSISECNHIKTCNDPAQEAASGETGADLDICMNRSACIYVRAYAFDKLLIVQNTNRACVRAICNY